MGWFDSQVQTADAHICLLHTNLGDQMVNFVYHNEVNMDIAAIAMGRSWLYYKDAIHHALSNSYIITVEEKKHLLELTDVEVAQA